MTQRMLRNLAYFASNHDIKIALGCSDNNILKYSQLAEYESILDLLPDSFDYKIILLENQKNTGHWVCLIRMGNIIECFNSYGISIDSEFKFIPDWIERWLNQDTRYLSKLIKSAPDYITVISNKFRFQSADSHIATCGRWVIFRVELSKMGYGLEEFVNKVKAIKDRYDLSFDEIVLGFVPFSGDTKK